MSLQPTPAKIIQGYIDYCDDKERSIVNHIGEICVEQQRINGLLHGIHLDLFSLRVRRNQFLDQLAAPGVTEELQTLKRSGSLGQFEYELSSVKSTVSVQSSKSSKFRVPAPPLLPPSEVSSDTILMDSKPPDNHEQAQSQKTEQTPFTEPIQPQPQTSSVPQRPVVNFAENTTVSKSATKFPIPNKVKILTGQEESAQKQLRQVASIPPPPAAHAGPDPGQKTSSSRSASVKSQRIDDQQKPMFLPKPTVSKSTPKIGSSPPNRSASTRFVGLSRTHNKTRSSSLAAQMNSAYSSGKQPKSTPAPNVSNADISLSEIIQQKVLRLKASNSVASGPEASGQLQTVSRPVDISVPVDNDANVNTDANNKNDVENTSKNTEKNAHSKTDNEPGHRRQKYQVPGYWTDNAVASDSEWGGSSETETCTRNDKLNNKQRSRSRSRQRSCKVSQQPLTLENSQSGNTNISETSNGKSEETSTEDDSTLTITITIPPFFDMACAVHVEGDMIERGNQNSKALVTLLQQCQQDEEPATETTFVETQ